MAKKGSGAGSSKKAPVQPTSKEDDGSYIIFGDGKSKKDKKKKPESGSGQGGEGNGTPSAEDVPKKPDVRQLIGGASWTGKFPVNLLSEHCQKQKWAKPEYTMVSLYSAHFANGITPNLISRVRQHMALHQWS